MRWYSTGRPATMRAQVQRPCNVGVDPVVQRPYVYVAFRTRGQRQGHGLGRGPAPRSAAGYTLVPIYGIIDEGAPRPATCSRFRHQANTTISHSPRRASESLTFVWREQTQIANGCTWRARQPAGLTNTYPHGPLHIWLHGVRHCIGFPTTTTGSRGSVRRGSQCVRPRAATTVHRWYKWISTHLDRASAH